MIVCERGGEERRGLGEVGWGRGESSLLLVIESNDTLEHSLSLRGHRH